MSEEWGPWIEHDGKKRPVASGEFVHVVYFDGEESTGPSFSEDPWVWGRIEDMQTWRWDGLQPVAPIIRYRIRKPRGLTILEGLLENLPEGVFG